MLTRSSCVFFLKTIATFLLLGTPAFAQLFVSISLPYATRGVAYTAQTHAGGGTPPFTFNISQGNLPPGLQLEATGAISGTPTHAGNYTFTISALDSLGTSGSGAASITVAGTTLVVSPGNIPQGHVGVAYAPVSFSVSGGVPPYALTLSSAAPPGMSFNPNTWVMSGIPTTGGYYSLEFLASDQAGDVTVTSPNLPIPDIASSMIWEGAVGLPYGLGFYGIGFNGNAQISFAGQLPPGMSFSASSNNGELAGSPTVAGTFTFTISGAAGGLTASRTYSATILSSPPIQIGGVPFGTVGVPYNQTIPVFYATPPVTVTLTGFALPAGLTLSPAGVLSGTPTQYGQFPLTLSVVDSTGKSGTGSIQFVIAPPLLSVSPNTIPDGAVGQPYSVTFSGSGGTPPYHYSLGSYRVPGLSLDPDTGVLAGTPISGGVYAVTINASDRVFSYGGQTYTLNISGPNLPFTMTPATLPDGIAGKSYYGSVNSTIVYAGDPTAQVTFAVTGGMLPPGLVSTPMANGITINRLPTTPGSYQFELTGTDINNRSVSRNYTISIASQAITVKPVYIPAAIASLPYSINFSASGGSPPYTYAAFNINSQQPAFLGAMVLSPSGTLSGLPQGGTVTFTVQATDSTGNTGSWDYTLIISQATLILSPESLPNASLGQAYSTSMIVYGGTAPYAYSISNGSLPKGLTLSPDGTLAGTPQQAGRFDVSIGATDASGAGGSHNYQFMVDGAKISLGPATLPDPMVGQPYLVKLTASGGVAPYVFSMQGINIWVAGLQMVSDGTISGTANASAPALLDFNVIATDANGSTGTREFFMNLRYGALSLAPTVVPSGTVGTSYTAAISASGGTPPYVFSAYPSTPLPDGLTISNAGVLSGTPVYAAQSFITVKAVDSSGAFGTQNYSIVITNPLSAGSDPDPVSCAFSVSPGGAVFPSSGGMGSITITTTSGCPWRIANIPGWVSFTNPVSGTGSSTVTFQVGQNAGPDISAVVSVAGVDFSFEQQATSVPGMTFAGSMPHTASAENWITTFTLVADGSSPATARLSLFGDAIDPSGDGPLALPLTFPQVTSAAALRPISAASLDRTLAPNASLILDTAAPQVAPVVVGSAQLAATSAVRGFAIFHQIQTGQEAVVPMETRDANSYVLAFDNTNGIALGVAVANVSEQKAHIPVIIRDDTGGVIGPPGAMISLEGNGHASFPLSDSILGFPVTAGKRGTVEFDTPVGGRISVLGLRFTPPNNALTTIPALANVAKGGGGSIAHIASGGDGWQTTFVLVNTGSGSAQATLSFFADQSGAPLSLPLSFPQSGGGATMAVPSYTTQIAAGATLIVLSKGVGDLLTGSAQLNTTGNVTGFVIFRHNDQEAVVPLESGDASAYMLAFDNTKGTATGIALNAVSTGQVNIPVTVRDDAGVQIAADTITLNANGHYAFTLGTDRYSITLHKRGTIEFDTPAGARIGALGIRIPDGAAHTYTTLPALVK